MRFALLHIGLWAALLSSSLWAEPSVTHKLLFMYRFFYLPFEIQFEPGQEKEDVLPFVELKDQTKRLLTPAELGQLDKEYEILRTDWQKKSLFLNVPIQPNETKKISSHLYKHFIPLNRKAFDKLSLEERIQIQHALKDQPAEVQKSFAQIRFFRSLVENSTADRFYLFVVGPHWCLSTLTYRILFESYVKQFPHPELELHAVIIEDPKEEIFDSELMKTLFPFEQKYSHQSVPRFAAIEIKNQQMTFYEEGDALKVAWEKYFQNKAGYLNHKTTLFKNEPTKSIPKPQIPDLRVLSSITK